jgi:hypothetical protein
MDPVSIAQGVSASGIFKLLQERLGTPGKFNLETIPIVAALSWEKGE